MKDTTALTEGPCCIASLLSAAILLCYYIKYLIEAFSYSLTIPINTCWNRRSLHEPAHGGALYTHQKALMFLYPTSFTLPSNMGHAAAILSALT